VILVGMMKRTTFQRAGEECWGAAFQQGVFDKLAPLEDWVCTDVDPYIGLGHMSRFTGQDEFQYVIGRFVEPAAPVPDGMYAEDIPAGTVAKMWIEGDTLNDIIDCAYLLGTEAIAKTGYKIDHEHFYWCDIYTYARYCTPLEKGDKIMLDYIMPVFKDASPIHSF
jgi:AraC family transcriptional regulator